MCTFDDGLGELPRRLYEAHADSIALETPVTQIRNCEHEEGFELVTENDAAVVDDVVLTTPAGTSADLLESVDSGLAATLDRFNYNPIAIVFLESAFDREDRDTRAVDGAESDQRSHLEREFPRSRSGVHLLHRSWTVSRPDRRQRRRTRRCRND